jgi:hypothetical protein
MFRKVAAASLIAVSAATFLSAAAQQVGVADEQITERDIDQRGKFDQLARHKKPSR